MKDLLSEGKKKRYEQDVPVRIMGLPRSTSIREIRSDKVGTLIQIEGMVRTISEVRPRIVRSGWRCASCGFITMEDQGAGSLSKPDGCDACNKRTLFLDEHSCIFTDSQRMKVQERPEGLRGGEIPTSIDVEISEDLCGKLTAGTSVKVVGILRSFLSEKKDSPYFELKLEGISVDIPEDLDISDEDELTILNLAKDPDIYNKLIGSISPTIYGNELIKEAIAIQLFGGTAKVMPDSTKLRGDIHVLIVGDPGVAKSQILYYVSTLAPRAVYATGKSSSGVGLCIAPDSLVWVEGKLVTIESAVERYFKGKSVDTMTCIEVDNLTQFNEEYDKITHVWKIPAPYKMVKISYNCGQITTTPETKLMTTDGWKEARDIKICDLLISDKYLYASDYLEVLSMEWISPNYEYVYDLTVKDSHCFIANGVKVHNTATVSKDELTGRWTLEAGAMVLADKGYLIVDEIEKMGESDRSAMHNGLENQRIDVSKAGICASLSCRCSLLAAANPKHGRFNIYESLADQIELPPSLLSRFDLIFTYSDIPDPTKDEKIASHILNTHHVGEKLIRKMEITSNEKTTVTAIINPTILKKYISYAKKNCTPVLTDESKSILLQYYLSVRELSQGGEKPVPITARAMDGLIRLSEAVAKIRLSDTITAEDATRVVRLMDSCLRDVAYDKKTGLLDIDRLVSSSSKASRDMMSIVKEAIEKCMDEEAGNKAKKEDILKYMEQLGHDHKLVETTLQKLHESRDILFVKDMVKLL